MIQIKNAAELEKMRKAAAISAAALKAGGEAIEPGITTAEIDKIIYDFIVRHGARPNFLHLYGFPATACISVNDTVIHGIPSRDQKIRPGDIVSIDTGCKIDGFNGDNACTFACGKLDVDTAAAVVGGIAKGCELAGCALIGGETAEMPGMYPAGEYDLAGFAVGAVEKSKILTGQNVAPGDVVLGLASHGVHSNGFSLVRKCIERAEAAGTVPATLDGKPFKQAIMEPTRLYVKNVLAALAAHPIKALAHITGGGLLENIPRVLPEGTAAHLKKGSWPQTELFAWLQKTAGIDDIEMNRTFNNGIGMVVVVDAANAEATAATLRAAGEQVYTIGTIAQRGEGAAVVVA